MVTQTNGFFLIASFLSLLITQPTTAAPLFLKEAQIQAQAQELTHEEQQPKAKTRTNSIYSKTDPNSNSQTRTNSIYSKSTEINHNNNNSNTKNNKNKGTHSNNAQNTKDKDNLYPSNCINLEDGIYEMQLIDDTDYPRVKIRCDNGYAILNPNLDPNIRHYFSSWEHWHHSTVGPNLDDLSNWSEWYLPDGGNSAAHSHNYLVSPDCNSCEFVEKRQLYGKQSTYWMTGQFFGCYWRVKANSNCDMNYETEECYTCLSNDRYVNDITNSVTLPITDSSSEIHYAYTGVCTHNIRRATHAMPQTQEECTTSRTDLVQGSQNLKPSLGTKGSYCACVQPANTHYTDYFESLEPSDSSLDTSNSDNNANMAEMDGNRGKIAKTAKKGEKGEERSKTEVIELYQRDFTQGTYRIRKSGVYKVMEDIVFDFNPINGDYNGLYSYWPLASQNNNDEYPGARDYRDEYSMGFFAGVSIEADDVTLDLNGHTLQMSKYFYLQQAWFTIIELSQQYFLPGESFAFFGNDPHLSKNIEIKNGVLGLSSHHGIHGNSNQNVVMSNLQIKHFNTHGIQLNGFDKVVLKDIEIGPSSDISYFRGQWAVARVLRRRWQHIADETIGQSIIFKNRDDTPVSMQDIVNQLSETMEIGWKHVTNKYNVHNNYLHNSELTSQKSTHNSEKGTKNVENDENEEYEELLADAIDMFVNPSGIPSGASMYGIFLNKFGASVFTYNLYSNQFSSHARLENIKIHGLKHSMQEWPYLIATTLNDINGNGIATDEIKNPFFGPLSAKDLFNEFPSFENGYPSYKGNIITDGYIASTKLMENNVNSFKYLGQQCILNDVLVDWATVPQSNEPQQHSRSIHSLDTMNKYDKYDEFGVWQPPQHSSKHSRHGREGGRRKVIKKKDGLGSQIQLGCNMDTMNHPGKGLLGIRIDSVRDVIIKNVEIYDNHDSTPLGSTACGDYNELYTNTDGFEVKKTGHFRQNRPFQIGFSGNMNQGIALSASNDVRFEGDINIYDLTSQTGPVFGIAIWPNVEAKFNGDLNEDSVDGIDSSNDKNNDNDNVNINIYNLESGGSIEHGKYTYHESPNRGPEVCGIRFYEKFGKFESYLEVSENVNVNLGCMAGDYGCFGQKDQYMMDTNDRIDGMNGLNIKSSVINHESCEFRFENSKIRAMSNGRVDAVTNGVSGLGVSSNDNNVFSIINVALFGTSGGDESVIKAVWIAIYIACGFCLFFVVCRLCCGQIAISNRHRAGYLRNRETYEAIVNNNNNNIQNNDEDGSNNKNIFIVNEIMDGDYVVNDENGILNVSSYSLSGSIGKSDTVVANNYYHNNNNNSNNNRYDTYQ